MELNQLVQGQWYRFSHKRKQVFDAKFRQYLHGDTGDSHILEVLIPVSGPQQHLSTTNGNYRLSGLRSSLIYMIEPIQRPIWLSEPPHLHEKEKL